MIPVSSAFWPVIGTAGLILFFLTAAAAAFLIRQKRVWRVLFCLPILCMLYFLEQCIIMAIHNPAAHAAGKHAAAWVAGLPGAVIVLALLFALSADIWLLLDIRSYERKQITAMSVKEAIDSLPAGILMYLPGGRVVMINRAMENYSQRLTGGMVINGERFRERLVRGELLPGCVRLSVQKTTVIMLPDGTACSVTEKEAPYQHTMIHRVLLSDVTETYHKTQSLQKMQQELTELNRRLSAYNQEIVALTAEKELLDARVRLHDQMGEDLLRMKRAIVQGCTEAEAKGIEAVMRRNISFIKTGKTAFPRDEITLMLETAEKLGVHVTVEGKLPGTEPQKHILATALHECITNTIRHAHGNALQVQLKERAGRMEAVFTNNGVPPEGPIQEKGGLRALRRLAEQAGGSLSFETEPVFSMNLSLPKEVPYGLQSSDRG